MKPAAFSYVSPETVSEVMELLGRYGEDCKLLAGGQSLLPMLGMRLHRPSVVVDLNRVAELSGIEEANGTVRIGAMTRHSSMEHSPLVASQVPLLSQAVPQIGHAAIRNRGTLGGSVVHNHPASELPAVAAALDAELVVRGPSGERTLGPGAFFTSYLSTALGEDELLTSVRFPVLGSDWRTSFLEFSRRVGDFALVGVAVAVRLAGGGCAEGRIALTGVGGIPTRARAAEGLLSGAVLDAELLSGVSEAVKGEVEPLSDFHGSSDYRRHLCGVLVGRALASVSEGVG